MVQFEVKGMENWLRWYIMCEENLGNPNQNGAKSKLKSVQGKEEKLNYLVEVVKGFRKFGRNTKGIS